MSVGGEGLAELAWPGKRVRGGLLMQVAVLQRRKLSGWHLISDDSLSRLSVTVGHGKNCPSSCNCTVNYLNMLEAALKLPPPLDMRCCSRAPLPLDFHGGEIWPD